MPSSVSEPHVDAGAHADVEGDLHWSSMRHYLQEPQEPLRREVLLVGVRRGEMIAEACEMQ